MRIIINIARLILTCTTHDHCVRRALQYNSIQYPVHTVSYCTSLSEHPNIRTIDDRRVAEQRCFGRP